MAAPEQPTLHPPSQDTTNTPAAGSASAHGGGGGGVGSSGKKQKSMGVLAQRFIMLFMEKPGVPVSLEEAGDRLIFGPDCPAEDKTKSEGKGSFCRWRKTNPPPFTHSENASPVRCGQYSVVPEAD